MTKSIENNKGLSDKFFEQVDAMSEDDFVSMTYAVERRKQKERTIYMPDVMNKISESTNEQMINVLLKTRQGIANHQDLSNDQKIHCLKVVNSKLKELGYNLDNDDLSPPLLNVLLKTRQGIANHQDLSNDQKIHCVKVVNSKLKELGYNFDNNDLPLPLTKINQVM